MPVNLWIPRTLSVFGFVLATYDIFFFVGVVLFFVIFILESNRYGVKWDKAAIVGAVIPFVGIAFSHAFKHVTHGNAKLSLYIAGLSAILGGGAYARWQRISIFRIGDVAALAAVFAFMKLGCLISGCCYGVPTER